MMQDNSSNNLFTIDSYSSHTNLATSDHDNQRRSNSTLFCCPNQNSGRQQFWKELFWRVVNFVMFVLFAAATVFQWNDTDGHWWSIAYIIPCLFCMSITVYFRIQTYLIWKVLVAVHMLGCFAGLIFIAAKYRKKLEKAAPNITSIEEGWELCGLIIVVNWLGIISIVASYCCFRGQVSFRRYSVRDASNRATSNQNPTFQPTIVQ